MFPVLCLVFLVVTCIILVGRRARRIAAKESGPETQSLFDALRNWRAAEAKAQRIPPYVIFHDAVLRDIAAVRPVTVEELGQIKGVGASKMQRYGAAVLEILSRSAG